MTYTPQADIYLCSYVPLDNRYEHVIKFASDTQRVSYFSSFVVSSFLDYKYIKNENAIDLPVSIDSCRSVNYLYYRNNDKTIYCFVIDKIYLNENTTRFIIETDVYTTYIWDYELKPCFVEREHRDRWFWSDTEDGYRPVKNLTNEPVYYGNNYNVAQTYQFIQPQYRVRWLALFSTEPLFESGTESKLLANNHRHPFYTYFIPFRENGSNLYFRQDTSQTPQDLGGLTHFLASQTANIVGVCLLTDYTGYYTVSMVNSMVTITCSSLERVSLKDPLNGYACLKQSNTLSLPCDKEYVINRVSDVLHSCPTTISTTRAKHYSMESRLHFTPYSHMMVHDNVNTPLVFSNDGFDSSYTYLKLYQSYSYPVRSQLTVEPYMNDLYGNLHKLTNNQSQEMALLDSNYINYIRNNKNSIATGLSIGALTGLASGGFGSVASMGMAGLNVFGQIAMQTAKESDLEQIPSNYRNLGSDFYMLLASNKTAPVILKLEIQNQYKNSVADYFYHYGYRVNEYKIPNTTGRYYFNFVKTVGCNIYSGIDTRDKQKLASIFDNGVTIWHFKTTNFKINDYTYDNPETSLL